MMPKIKVCGTTTSFDARLAFEAGADFLGVVVHPASPRHVVPERISALETQLPLVLVSVNRSLDELESWARQFEVHALQLHGDEAPELVSELQKRGFCVWKAIHGDEEALRRAAQTYAGADALLVDAREDTSSGTIYGGTGKASDWNTARLLVEDGHKIVLAGGLTPQNVARAIGIVQPWAVDVVSGVEARKGVKDAQSVRDFVQNARHSSRKSTAPEPIS